MAPLCPVHRVCTSPPCDVRWKSVLLTGPAEPHRPLWQLLGPAGVPRWVWDARHGSAPACDSVPFHSTPTTLLGNYEVQEAPGPKICPRHKDHCSRWSVSQFCRGTCWMGAGWQQFSWSHVWRMKIQTRSQIFNMNKNNCLDLWLCLGLLLFKN